MIASTPRGSTDEMRSRELVAADAGRRRHEDRADLARLVGDVAPGAAGSVNAVKVVWPRPSASPKVAMPTIVTADRLRGLHDRRVAEVEVARLRGTAVDHDLVGRSGGAPGDESVRVQLGVGDPAAGLAGWPVPADGVAVAPEQRPVADDLGFGVLHAVDAVARSSSSDSSIRPRFASGVAARRRWRCARRRRCWPTPR